MSLRAVHGLLALALLAFATSARAELGTIENEPAATLLLPYFEVDLGAPTGITTVFSIVNAGSYGLPPETFNTIVSAAVAHITLWTDLGIPTFAFDVYFTGFDVQSINLRDVFNGVLPITASDGQDPSDTISPQGIMSQDINFASCNGILPYPVPALTAPQIADLRSAHTGKASGLLGGDCGGRDFGDNVARGFVTIDNVTRCSPLFPPVFPSSAGYFTSLAFRGNYFAGDFQFAELATDSAQGDALVAIQADPSMTPIFGPGSYTFYGRFVGGDGSDRREPLATRWAVPFTTKPAHSVVTEVIVWRDPIIAVAPFACGGALPAPFPIGTMANFAFDTAENPMSIAPAQPPFPVVAQRVRVDGPPGLEVPHRAGWLFLDLNSSGPIAASPFNDKSARQSWVMMIKRGEGRFSSGHAAIQMDSPIVEP